MAAIGSWLLSVILPLAIHFGAEWVIAHFPKLPDWAKAILQQLGQAKAAADQIADPVQRAAAHGAARAVAIHAVKQKCSGVACPPEPVGND